MEPTDDLLRGLLAAAPDALLASDHDGRIVFANNEAQTVFGWPAADLLGQPIECLLPRRLRGAPMGAALDVWARRRDGSEFPAEVSVSTFSINDGVFTVAAIRDVTERVHVEKERRLLAEQAQRDQLQRLESLGQLAGGVAHDFNNLLGVILNYTGRLGRRFSDADADVAEEVGQICAAVERAASLTRQLLAFARPDATNPAPLDINEVIREFSMLLERILGDDIRLRLDLSPGQLGVVTDRHQIEQVLLNLALNSRDAMADGGVLTITTSPDDADDGEDAAVRTSDPSRSRRATLEVSDTGVGMD
ncbi:MAG TPA: PAS domain S-box protein, partial [Ilumatobacteraceae bacterium]